jgi:predicted dehydrogenase
MIKLALIGYGYWGPNLLRNFEKLKNCKVDYVVDYDQLKLQKVKDNYPSISTSTSIDNILENPKIHAVIIATPVSTHFSIAKKALEKGKHVLLEKPMTDSTSKAKQLIELAKKKELTLMVDHTYLYTGTIKKIKELISSKQLGEINYIDSIRSNLGIFQSDINVLWDLAPHDISICNYLLNELPISVQAIGKSHTKMKKEDIAYLTLHYKSKKIIHINCSWISPIKIRQCIIGGTKKMIVFDDTLEKEKITMYNTNFKEESIDIKNNKSTIKYNVGEKATIGYDSTEALELLALDFINSIQNQSIPISNYSVGMEIVKILEAAEKSVQNDGKIIYV